MSGVANQNVCILADLISDETSADRIWTTLDLGVETRLIRESFERWRDRKRKGRAKSCKRRAIHNIPFNVSNICARKPYAWRAMHKIRLEKTSFCAREPYQWSPINKICFGRSNICGRRSYEWGDLCGIWDDDRS
jgi:hypothetical protein